MKKILLLGFLPVFTWGAAATEAPGAMAARISATLRIFGAELPIVPVEDLNISCVAGDESPLGAKIEVKGPIQEDPAQTERLHALFKSRVESFDFGLELMRQALQLGANPNSIIQFSETLRECVLDLHHYTRDALGETVVLLLYGAEPDPDVLFKPIISPTRTQLMIFAGVDVHKKDGNGETALIKAIREADTSHVEFLLENGANPLSRSSTGETAHELSIHLMDRPEDSSDDVSKRENYSAIANIISEYSAAEKQGQIQRKIEERSTKPIDALIRETILDILDAALEIKSKRWIKECEQILKVLNHPDTYKLRAFRG
jgi:hypothetical protein